MEDGGLDHIVHALIPFGTAILGAAIAGPLGLFAGYKIAVAGYAAATYGAIIGAGVGAAGVELYEHATEK